jgi:SNF2 family DNA or RNA helicase
MQLREYQEQDLESLLRHDAMCIFNEQRTGKTPTSIMCMKQRGVQRLLVICPASMVYKWKEEYETWTDKKAYVVPVMKVIQKKGADFTASAWIINYERIRGTPNESTMMQFIAKKYKPDGLIVDEVHRCKERSTLNYIAVNKFNHVPYRLYLTGTPAPNKQQEVWAPLHFTNPKELTSYWNWIEEYFHMDMTQYSQFAPPVREIGDLRAEKTKDFLAYLAEYSIMRKRADVMPWLPKQDAPTNIKLPCTPTQKKYIQSLIDTFEVDGIECEGVLDSLIRMRQICSAPAILKLKGSSPKLEWLQQYVSDYPEKQIILFSNSKKLLKLIEGVVPCKLITGDVTLEKRQQLVNMFQNDLVQILGIQTQAGKEGLTLDKADVTIFLDTYPPAADYLQAKDRMVPTMPERVKPQEIIHLMMADTYDEQLYQLVQRNVEQTAVINDYINYINERRTICQTKH